MLLPRCTKCCGSATAAWIRCARSRDFFAAKGSRHLADKIPLLPSLRAPILLLGSGRLRRRSRGRPGGIYSGALSRKAQGASAAAQSRKAQGASLAADSQQHQGGSTAVANKKNSSSRAAEQRSSAGRAEGFGLFGGGTPPTSFSDSSCFFNGVGGYFAGAGQSPQSWMPQSSVTRFSILPNFRFIS